MQFDIKGDGLDLLMGMFSAEEMQRRAQQYLRDVIPSATEEANNLLQAQPLIDGQASWQMNDANSVSIIAKVKSALGSIRLPFGVKRIKLIPKRGGVSIVLVSKERADQSTEQEQPSVLEQAWDAPQVTQTREEAKRRLFQLRQE